MSWFDGDTSGMDCADILREAAAACRDFDSHLQDEGTPQFAWAKAIKHKRDAVAARQKAEVIAIVDARLRELGLLGAIAAEDLLS